MATVEKALQCRSRLNGEIDRLVQELCDLEHAEVTTIRELAVAAENQKKAEVELLSARAARIGKSSLERMEKRVAQYVQRLAKAEALRTEQAKQRQGFEAELTKAKAQRAAHAKVSAPKREVATVLVAPRTDVDADAVVWEFQQRLAAKGKPDAVGAPGAAGRSARFAPPARKAKAEGVQLGFGSKVPPALQARKPLTPLNATLQAADASRSRPRVPRASLPCRTPRGEVPATKPKSRQSAPGRHSPPRPRLEASPMSPSTRSPDRGLYKSGLRAPKVQSPVTCRQAGLLSPTRHTAQLFTGKVVHEHVKARADDRTTASSPSVSPARCAELLASPASS